MNCLNWYLAYSFCIWDGGRLPTEAEWNGAAAGGAEQRPFPWGSVDPSPGLSAYLMYARVGSVSPAGDGVWGHADLAGSVWEWARDSFGDYPLPCVDCVALSTGSNKVLRGGAVGFSRDNLSTYFRYFYDPGSQASTRGVRCVAP